MILPPWTAVPLMPGRIGSGSTRVPSLRTCHACAEVIVDFTEGVMREPPFVLL